MASNYSVQDFPKKASIFIDKFETQRANPFRIFDNKKAPPQKKRRRQLFLSLEQEMDHPIDDHREHEQDNRLQKCGGAEQDRNRFFEKREL